MNLTTKQLAVQEAMLLRLYPGKRLEQAKMQGEFSQIYVKISMIDLRTGYVKYQYVPRYKVPIEKLISRDDEIGLPPTLPRVLDALTVSFVEKGGRGRAIVYRDGAIYDYTYPSLDDKQKICDRKLRNKDGTDATLRDQSQETHDAVGRLLGVE